MRHGLIVQNVAAIEGAPKVDEEEVQVVPKDRIGELIDKLRGRAMYARAITSLFTGMRRGEVLALPWHNTKLDAKVIEVRAALEQTRDGIKLKSTKTKNGKRDDLKDLGVSLGHRRLLLKAIADLAAQDADAALASAAEATPQKKERATGAERRQLTVMFVDLVGSTELAARLDPEDMGGVIRAYQGCCAEVIGRWGGHVAKYMGDGVLAYFGWPQAHEDEAERAVRAGLALSRCWPA